MFDIGRRTSWIQFSLLFHNAPHNFHQPPANAINHPARDRKECCQKNKSPPSNIQCQWWPCPEYQPVPLPQQLLSEHVGQQRLHHRAVVKMSNPDAKGQKLCNNLHAKFGKQKWKIRNQLNYQILDIFVVVSSEFQCIQGCVSQSCLWMHCITGE